MAITTTANLDTEIAKEVVRSVVVVAIDGVAERFTTGSFVGQLADDVELIMPNTLLKFNKLNLLRSRVDPGTFRFTLVVDADTHDLINSNLIGKEVTIRYGTSDLAIADFLTYAKMFIVDARLNSSSKTFEIICQDGHFKLKRTLFSSLGTDEMDGTLSDTGTLINVNDSSVFIDPAAGLPAYFPATYVRIDSEIIEYDGIVGNGLTVADRGALETVAAAHADEAPVSQVYRVKDFPGEFIVATLLSGISTTNGLWDANKFSISNFGLGIDEADVDINGILVAFKSIASGLDVGLSEDATLFYDFIIDTQEKGETFYQKFFAIAAPSMIYIGNDQLFTVKMFDDIFDTSVVNIFTSNLGPKPTVRVNYNQVVNNALVTNAFARNEDFPEGVQGEHRFSLTSSLSTTNGLSIPQEITTKTIFRVAPFGSAVNNRSYTATCRRLFWLFSKQHQVIKSTLTKAKVDVEVGDWVQYTDTGVIDIGGEAYGLVAANALVIGRETNFTGPDVIEIMLFNDIDDGTKHRGTVEVFNSAIDDQALIENADVAPGTLQGDDAFYDSPSPDGVSVAFFEINITPNGGGTDDQESIDIRIQLQEPVSTNIMSRDFRLYYDPSTPFPIRYFCSVNTTDTTFAAIDIKRFRVDWFASSATFATVQYPSFVTFVQLTYTEIVGTLTLGRA